MVNNAIVCTSTVLLHVCCQLLLGHDTRIIAQIVHSIAAAARFDSSDWQHISQANDVDQRLDYCMPVHTYPDGP